MTAQTRKPAGAPGSVGGQFDGRTPRQPILMSLHSPTITPDYDNWAEVHPFEVGIDEGLDTIEVTWHDDGTSTVTATHYTDLNWNDEFDVDELDSKSRQIEQFFHNRYGVEAVLVSDDPGVLQITIRREFPERTVLTLQIVGESLWWGRGGVAELLNEEDPGTYGVPYVGRLLAEHLHEVVNPG